MTKKLSHDHFVHALEARAFTEAPKDEVFRLDPRRRPRSPHLSTAPALTLKEEWAHRRFLLNETCHFFRLKMGHAEDTRRHLPAVLRTLPEASLKRYGREVIAGEEAHLRWCSHFLQDHGGGFPAAMTPPAKDAEPAAALMRLYVFKEILHAFDQSAAADTELDPLVSGLHRRQADEDRRSLAYLRRLVKDGFEKADAPARERLVLAADQATTLFWSAFWSEDLFHGLHKPAPAEGLKLILSSKDGADLRERFSRRPALFLRNLKR